MNARHAIPLFAFGLLLVLVPIVTADDAAPPETVFLDLDGIPERTVVPPRKAYAPSPLEGVNGDGGWVLRLRETAVIAAPGGPKISVPSPSPAVAGGRVFVGGGVRSTSLHALDARTGKRLWTRALSDNGPTTVAAGRDYAVVNTESCTTYALDSVTGKRVWSEWLGPSIHAAPAITKNRVYAAYTRSDGDKYGFRAMSLAKGKTIWDVDLPSDIRGAPICAFGRIYATLVSGQVVCFDERGKLVWQAAPGASSAPTVGPGGVYVAASGRVIRLDPGNGTTIWDRRVPSAVRWTPRTPGKRGERPETITDVIPKLEEMLPGLTLSDPPRPVLIGSRCYLGQGRDLVVLDTASGRVEKRIRLPEGRMFASPPAVIGRNLLFATADGLLVEIEPRVGAVRRALDLKVPISSQPVFADGRVHATSSNLVIGVPWTDEKLPDYGQWGGGPERGGI